MTATSVPVDPATGLERNAIGLPEVLFQSITHMAPAVATALSIGVAMRFTAPIVGAWIAIGVVIFVVLWIVNRQALRRMGDVYGGEVGTSRIRTEGSRWSRSSSARRPPR